MCLSILRKSSLDAVLMCDYQNDEFWRTGNVLPMEGFQRERYVCKHVIKPASKSWTCWMSTIYWKGWGHEPTPDLCVRYFTFVRFSCFCPRVCLQGSWNMQVWRNMPWFLQPLSVSSNSWPLPCNAQGRAEAHLGPVVLVKLSLHEDVCGCFWNEICVWICLKERANMLNCSP